MGDACPTGAAGPRGLRVARVPRALERALGELPLDYRSAVTLRDVDGLSTAEAAEALGIGERALKSRLHRGRMALREKLDHYFAEGYV